MNSKNLGKYQIYEKLGEGATAEVFHAHDTVLGRDVALKILKPALVPDTSAFGRFILEAQAAAKLFHNHIATVLDMGEAEGRYFIAMRYVPGRSLDKILKDDGPLPWDDVGRMAQQIGAALDYAHGEGFLHRDVKPSNIIRDASGDFWLTDFGLTRAMMSTGLTSHTGAVLGTPAYIAPEIWNGEEADPATDQYALACVVYEMVTGEVLFSGETPPAIMTAHVLHGFEFNTAFHQKAPEGVDTVLTRALSKNSAERFGDMSAFLNALESNRFTKEPPPEIDTQTASPTSDTETEAVRPAETLPKVKTPAAEKEDQQTVSTVETSNSARKNRVPMIMGISIVSGLIFILIVSWSGWLQFPTATPTPTNTPLPFPTQTQRATATITPTDIPTKTPTPTPTLTLTITRTPSPTHTEIPTDTPTATPSVTPTPTNTAISIVYPCEENISGTWTGKGGGLKYTMTLSQSGCHVSGWSNTEDYGTASITGEVKDGVFTFSEYGNSDECYWKASLTISGNSMSGKETKCIDSKITLSR
jgi:eukaryotic-like serine/threonine-protein kinase